MIARSIWFPALALAATAHGQDLKAVVFQPPPTPLYQVPFGTPPDQSTTAIQSIPQRAQAVLDYMACGDEFEFNSAAAQSVTESILQFSIAKVQWSSSLHLNLARPGPGAPPLRPIPGQICTASGLYSSQDVRAWFGSSAWNVSFPDLYLPNGTNVFNDGSLRTLSSEFANAVFNRYKCQLTSTAGPPDYAVSLSAVPAGAQLNDPNTGAVLGSPYLIEAMFSVSQRCMQMQVDAIIPTWVESGYAGTNPLPCYDHYIVGNVPDVDGISVPGDWDVLVRDLTRLYYLSNNNGGILANQGFISENLLTLDGPPGQDSYSVLQCGNAGDVDAGSPQQRAEEDSWGSNALQSIGDAFEWLFKRLLILLPFEGPVYSVVFSVLEPEIATAVAAIPTIVFEGASVSTIPESENHRLMIETSRYLNNQVIATQMPAGHDDYVKRYQGYADQGRTWLLKRLQGIMQGDFIEYNARPYQRYSIISLLNLWDFAPDPQLKTMAAMVLEYAELKFAIGGNQSRRSVPFRRLQEETDGVTTITDSTEGDDFQVSQMEFLAGQVQQFPQAPAGALAGKIQKAPNVPGVNGAAPPPSYLVSRSGVAEMVYLATSGFRPYSTVLDLAIRKDIPYYQQLSHSGGVEIYSGANSYVVSAGGVETPAAYTMDVDFVSVGRQIDHGAGVPTALVPAVGSGDTDRLDFIRIEGYRQDYGLSGNPNHKDWRNVSYQGNTCVWKGFACGTGVAIPNRFISDTCKLDAQGAWLFLDSANCDANAPNRFLLAIYRQPCPAGDAWCPASAMEGFFEVVDVPTAPPANPQPNLYATFRSSVIDNNKQPFDSPSATTGTYHSYSGHMIVFDCEAYLHDSSKWGIVSVDGAAQPDLGQWQPAQGDIVKATGDGQMYIFNPRTTERIYYNFSNWQAPVRTE